MAFVEASITVKGDKKTVYELTKDMEQFPQFMPDVESVKVVQRAEKSTVTEWAANIDGAPINWREQDEFDDDKPSIEYKLIEGDLDKFEGEWTFSDVPDGTCVRLTVEYDLGIAEFEELIGPILREKVQGNAQKMLEAIKEKAESSRSNYRGSLNG